MPADQIRNTPTSRGPIVVSRHGRPALDRTAKPRLGWQDYQDWWSRYEESELADGQAAPESLKAMVADAELVLSSVRRRAIETANMAAPHMEPVQYEVFNEAPLPPPRFKRAKFLPKTWNIYARTAWLWGHTLDGESVGEARERARIAALQLHEAAEIGKVYLAAHGWFNRMIRKELRKIGWRCVRNGGDSYWSYRVYEYQDRS